MASSIHQHRGSDNERRAAYRLHRFKFANADIVAAQRMAAANGNVIPFGHGKVQAKSGTTIAKKCVLTIRDYLCNLLTLTNVIYDAMKKAPRISETEWEVMKVVWAKGPCSAGEIIEALASTDPTWHPKTIKTFLNRLARKKALGFRKEGRAYLYRPLVRENECVDAASESFLERVFGGSLKPMLAHFVERKKLSAEEIRELRELLKNQR